MSNNLENNKKMSAGVIMSIVCGVILSMGAIHMDTINWILPTIAKDLAAGNSTLMVTSGFFYGMMIGHVIVGPLSDMIGKKKTMVFGFVICIVGAVIGSQSGPPLSPSRCLCWASGSAPISAGPPSSGCRPSSAPSSVSWS